MAREHSSDSRTSATTPIPKANASDASDAHAASGASAAATTSATKDTATSASANTAAAPTSAIADTTADTSATATRTTTDFHTSRPTFAHRCGTFFRWLIVTLACVWISWCTAIGPIMRSDAGLAAFGWTNALLFVIMFTCTFGFVLLLVYTAHRREGMFCPHNLPHIHPIHPISTSPTFTTAPISPTPHPSSTTNTTDSIVSSTPIVDSTSTVDNHTDIHTTSTTDSTNSPTDPTIHSVSPNRASTSSVIHRFHNAAHRFTTAASHVIMTTTSNWKRIWLVLIVCWLWIPTTLLAAFGADIYSQAREFAWAWNQWTGVEQPYIGFFSFVPMDIYPTAHYMWPSSPTYLTDQHNIVLTVFYGGALAISRYLTGSNDAGLVVLAALQWLFAGFCCASAANRFFNMPWLTRRANSTDGSPTVSSVAPYPGTPAGPCARLLVMIVFICCPLVLFSTISLTKSPLFAFTFTWWFGLMYELYMTHSPRLKSRSRTLDAHASAQNTPVDTTSAFPTRLSTPAAIHNDVSTSNVIHTIHTTNTPHTPRTRRVTIAALVVSVCIMLISAKYAWYILAAQLVFSILADCRRWKLYLCTLFLPTLLIHGSISALIASGAIISGDAIESRGIQIQMIARVARDNPDAIPADARTKLAPIFNLDQMAQAYRPQDADPVKSSGIQSKKVSYRWRSVTPGDMDNLNKAWLEIVRADPLSAFNGLFAKSYGYFDIFDPAYVPMSYYLDNDYVQQTNTWIKYYNHGWRSHVADFARGWSSIPVLGWFTHGNFYVTFTLLIGAAELALKRWRALSWHMPLLLLMGVMITAPANNFERHMLPIAFVFGFLCLMFHRDTCRRVDVPERTMEPITAHDTPRS